MGLEKHPVLVSVLVSKKLSGLGLGLGLEARGLDYNTGLGNTVLNFDETSQRWRAVDDTVSDLTNSKIEPQRFFTNMMYTSSNNILTIFLINIHFRLAQLLSARYRCGRSKARFPGRSNWHRIASGSPPPRRFFGAVLPRRYTAELGPATRYTIRRTAASILKI